MKISKLQLKKLQTPLAVASITCFGIGIFAIYSSLFSGYDIVGKNLSITETEPTLRQIQLFVNIGIGLVVAALVLGVLLAVVISGNTKPKLPKA